MTEAYDELQTSFLESLIGNRVAVSVFLINGIKLCGVIVGYDRFTVLLKERGEQLIFKHCISTIVPDHSY